jgi:hypothetical protein
MSGIGPVLARQQVTVPEALLGLRRQVAIGLDSDVETVRGWVAKTGKGKGRA